MLNVRPDDGKFRTQEVLRVLCCLQSRLSLCFSLCHKGLVIFVIDASFMLLCVLFFPFSYPALWFTLYVSPKRRKLQNQEPFLYIILSIRNVMKIEEEEKFIVKLLLLLLSLFCVSKKFENLVNFITTDKKNCVAGYREKIRLHFGTFL